jgi:uncharacterized protein YlxW (UPF0749 family)
MSRPVPRAGADLVTERQTRASHPPLRATMATMSPRPAPAAVDASMRLLREVMEQPLDPAYALAAGRRARGLRPGRAAVVLTTLIAVLCGWVLVRGVSELRRPEPGQAAGRVGVEHEIARRTAAADARQRQIQHLRDAIATAPQAQLTAQGDTALAAQVQELGLLSGEVPVHGPGLEIALADAPGTDASGATVDPRAVGGADDGRVIDRDVQITVNGLWACGAEAIAVNGRRLTSLSAIRSAGEAILVDFRPLVPPYRIQAVGDPAQLRAQFSTTDAAGYLERLHDSLGVQVSIAAATDLKLPAAGAFELRKAGVPSTPAPSSTTGGGPTRTGPGSAGTPSAPSSGAAGVAATSPARPTGNPSSREVRP